MVSYTALRDSRPGSWRAAADDWKKLAEEAERSAEDIYQRGRNALSEHWTDPLGQTAGARLKDLANRFEVAGAALRSAVSTLDGLAEAAEIVKGSLDDVLAHASVRGIGVDAAGLAYVLDGADVGRDELHEVDERVGRALKEATRIDDLAAGELHNIADAVDRTDLDQALNDLLAHASQDELAMLRATLPTGASPEEVLAWWTALSRREQQELELAVPVQLADLPGMPAGVVDSLRGDDYDRIELIRWAEKHWDDTDLDIFESNCAHFVSLALEHAGLKQDLDPWLGTLSDDGWGHGAQTGWDWLDEHDHSHTDSWAGAQSQREFMTSHGGRELPLSQARPGDLIYFENTAGGDTHHVAIVTAVTPDGDVHYTQHSDSRLDASLDGRLSHVQVSEGDQTVVIVRVDPNWY